MARAAFLGLMLMRKAALGFLYPRIEGESFPQRQTT